MAKGSCHFWTTLVLHCKGVREEVKRCNFIYLTIVFSVLFNGCGVVSSPVPSITSNTSTISSVFPEEASNPPDEIIIPTMLLPPVEHDIFSGREDDNNVYCSSVSACFFLAMVVLEDGGIITVGEFGPIDTRDPSYVDQYREEYGSHYDFKVIKSARYVSTDRWYRMAIDSDDVLWEWGTYWWLSPKRNIETGAFMREVYHKPVMPDVQMASAQNCFRLVLRKDGTVWTWGAGENGVLGLGIDSLSNLVYSRSNPLLEPMKAMDNAVFVAANWNSCYAIKDDGTLWGWGNIGIADENGELCRYTPGYIMSDVRYVSCNAAVKTDGSLWIWGAPARAWLHPEEEFLHDVSEPPIQIMTDVKYAKVSTSNGIRSIIVIKEDDSLWVWEDTYIAAIEEGSNDYRRGPIKIMDNVVYADFTASNLLILKSDGELWVSGSPSDITEGLGEIIDSGESNRLLDYFTPRKIIDGVLVTS